MIKAKNIYEIIYSRILPGLINLGLIIYVSQILGPEDYGLFSLSYVTIGFIVSVIFGAVESTIVPLLQKKELEGDTDFINRVYGTLLFSTIPILSLILIFQQSTLPYLLLFLGSALNRVTQSIIRAKLKFWLYGTVALLASILTLLLLILVSYTNSDLIYYTLLMFAIGYIVSSLYGWYFIGKPKPLIPNIETLKSFKSVGLPFTLANIAENVLYLGFRYSITLFGTPQLLSSFSYAIDLAQRSTGVVVNILSFSILPRVYKKNAYGDTVNSVKILKLSSIAALIMSVFILLVVVVFDFYGYAPKLLGENYSLTGFIIVSFAVVINRIKKMSIDPLYLVYKKMIYLPLSYIIISPLALVIVSIFMMQNQYLVYLVYMISYLVIAGISCAIIFINKREVSQV